ncbi:hypothetical protein J6E39_03070 [bacterium]|nr:hypothetical protein [bacterium]
MAAVGSIYTRFTNSNFYQSMHKGVKNFEQSFYNAIPNFQFKNKKTIDTFDKIGQKISSAENRLILGATALMSQPFIDASNKSVDEDTRKVSVARTIAKIVVGTTTGFLIRKGCIKLIKSSSKLENSVDKFGKKIKLDKFNTFFSPKGVKSDKTEAYSQYQNALGTIVALVVMMITNFAIDAPLTKLLTNKLVSKIDQRKTEGKKSS